MKNKRILVLGIALVLFALVVGVAFAASGNLNGVLWATIEGKIPGQQSGTHYIEIYNDNDYAVKATDDISRNYYLDAKETKRAGAYRDTRIVRVVRNLK